MKRIYTFLIAAALLLTADSQITPRAFSQSLSGQLMRTAVGDDRTKRRVPYMDERGPRDEDRPLYEIERLEQECLEQVNKQRTARGIPPLRVSPDLLQLARYYSWWMAEERFFSHTDPDGKTIKERVTESGIRWRVLGENIAYSKGYINPVAASMSGWMASDGHRRNILDSGFTQTAIGAWVSRDGTVYFTEIFMK